MSTAAGSPSKEKKAGTSSPERPNKGKGKNTEPPRDYAMEEEEDDDDDDSEGLADEEMEEYQEEDDDDDDDDDDDPEIDPSAIISSGRRTRGIKVDYTSKEAIEKAGLKPEEADDDEEDMKHE